MSGAKAAGRRRWAGALVFAGWLLTGCHAKEDAFFDRVFQCSPGDSCGSNRQGEPMMCYDTQKIGLHDFCADTCDPAQDPEEADGFVCLASGALFRMCQPSQGAGACPSGLNCLRTDLILDVGVCMDVPVCATDADCVGAGTHTTCAGPLLATFSDQLRTDHLFCLQSGCQAGASECSSGEVCLRQVVKNILSAPDVCVPKCDSQGNCPPNFVCARRVYGRLSADACVPGVPGYRCLREADCLLGSCTDTGAGYKECAFPCFTDDNCTIFNTANDFYTCVAPVPGGARHCILLNDLTGSACTTDADCDLIPDQKCFTYGPNRLGGTGECRTPCAADGTCAPRAGVDHVCLAGGAGGCYPGRFGLPCTADDQCATGFRCRSHDAPDGGAAEGGHCTLPCTPDGGECAANPWVRDQGYCDDVLCHWAAPAGAPCGADGDCASRSCVSADAGAIPTCATP